MQRLFTTGCQLALALVLLAAPTEASAQYAVGHRTFGIGTAGGAGFSRMDFQFPGVDPDEPFYLLPTLEMKAFLGDTLSIDLSVPVVNIAASQALQDYFFVTGEVYLGFHPSAPRSRLELFVSPGFGVSYAKWEDEDAGVSHDGYAFHIPVRVGLEINNQRRNFSFFVAARPFFSLVHGNDNTKPGGGGLIEIGLMAYTIRYRADRY